MAKIPYIQLFIGDHLKDTRILPLNVQGGWMILLLYMWENDPKGEMTGTMQDFTRLMSCSPQEAVLVIQTLKEKKICAWEDMDDGQLRIISRKQKKMVTLSEIRKKSGKNGGNPNLLNKNESKFKTLVNQKTNQNTEYDNEYKDRLEDVVGGVEGEEGGRKGFFGPSPPEGPDWPAFPNALQSSMFEIFLAEFPAYPRRDNIDLAACFQLGYQIGNLHGWPWESCLNGSMEQILTKWKEIVRYIKSDKWFRTKPLSFLAENFQGLIQAKNDTGNDKQNNRNNPNLTATGSPVVQSVVGSAARRP